MFQKIKRFTAAALALVLISTGAFAIPGTKLSQIANGGAANPATDQAVAVRSGTTDVLISLGNFGIPTGSTSSGILFNNSGAVAVSQATIDTIGNINTSGTITTSDSVNIGLGSLNFGTAGLQGIVWVANEASINADGNGIYLNTFDDTEGYLNILNDGNGVSISEGLLITQSGAGFGRIISGVDSVGQEIFYVAHDGSQIGLTDTANNAVIVIGAGDSSIAISAPGGEAPSLFIDGQYYSGGNTPNQSGALNLWDNTNNQFITLITSDNALQISSTIGGFNVDISGGLNTASNTLDDGAGRTTINNTLSVPLLTSNRVLISSSIADGPIVTSLTTDTEVGYVHGVTSAIQTQLNAKFGTAGTGLSSSGVTVSSNAAYQVSFQPGLITSITNTKTAFAKISKASTVDNITVSALLFTCVSNPTITIYECGTSTTCATPTTIGSATVTTTGTAVAGSISSASITAGDYIAWAISAGTCTSLDIAASAQIHSN